MRERERERGTYRSQELWWLAATAAFCGCRNVEALGAFAEHADATNDIFHVAAQVLAGTLLMAQEQLDTAHQRGGLCFPQQEQQGASMLKIFTESRACSGTFSLVAA